MARCSIVFRWPLKGKGQTILLAFGELRSPWHVDQSAFITTSRVAHRGRHLDTQLTGMTEDASRNSGTLIVIANVHTLVSPRPA